MEKSMIDQITTGISLASNYLKKHCTDGKFTYIANPNPETKFSKEEYNILRHAGTIYALATAQNFQPSLNAKATILASSDFLIRKTIAPLSDGNMLAVWSLPELLESKVIHAKLGGTGLGLVGLLTAESVISTILSKTDYEKMGNFLEYMQREDGNFSSKYNPAKGGRQNQWVSLYYPGEAALGLVLLYEYTQNEKWLNVAHKSLHYLAKSRKDAKEVPADHWVLIATAKFFQHMKKPTDKDLLINHAKQICEFMLSEQVAVTTKYPALIGAFSRDGRVTPASTRMEGMLATLEFLPKSKVGLRQKIIACIEKSMAFILRSQVKTGEYAGGIPRCATKFSGDSEKIKKFNRNATEIRVDYVQHALSAMIQYYLVIYS